MYGTIGQQSKQHIEGRLRRVSEFYSTVVCRFVVADMGVLLDVSRLPIQLFPNRVLHYSPMSCCDLTPLLGRELIQKYVKRGGSWCSD